jgi:hypothetical protein
MEYGFVLFGQLLEINSTVYFCAETSLVDVEDILSRQDLLPLFSAIGGMNSSDVKC